MAPACGVSYAEATAEAETLERDGVAIRIASPATLIRMKDTPRPQDALDRAFLAGVVRERAPERKGSIHSSVGREARRHALELLGDMYWIPREKLRKYGAIQGRVPRPIDLAHARAPRRPRTSKRPGGVQAKGSPFWTPVYD